MAWVQDLQRRFPGIASLLRNGALLAGTQWVEAGLRGFYALAISRWLGPEIYGAWSYATTAYAFALGLTLFGLESLVPLRLGRDRAATGFLATALLLRGGLLALAALVLTGNALLASADAAETLALLLVLPALFGRGFVMFARATLLGFDQSATAFRFAVALRLFELVVGLSCLWLGAGLFTLLAIHSVAWVAEAALGLRALGRRTRVRLRPDADELRQLLREGFVLGLVALGMAFLAAMPLLSLRHLTDDLAATGQFALASQIAALVVMGVQGGMSGALPVVARASSRGDPRLARYAVLTAFGLVLIFGLAIVVARPAGPVIVPALLGEGFAPAGALLAPALLVGGLSVLPTGAWQLLVARGQRWPGALAAGLGCLALIAALPPLVRASGPQGALTAAALAWGLRAAVIFLFAALPGRGSDAGAAGEMP